MNKLTPVAFATLLLLAACGGGSGGGGGTTPDATGNLDGTVGCEIPDIGTSCVATIKGATQNAANPKTLVGTTTVDMTASVNKPFTLGYGDKPVTLYNGDTVLASTTISGVCSDHADWDGNVCQPRVYNYTSLWLLIEGVHATISKIDGKNVTPLGNASEFTGNGGFPLDLCGIWSKIMPDGRPLASCVTPAAGNTRRNFPINPLTGEMMKEYKGAVPEGAVLQDTYDSAQPAPANYAANGVFYFGMYLDVSGVGTYYFTGADTKNLRLTKNDFLSNEIIHVGEHQFLKEFKNPKNP